MSADNVVILKKKLDGSYWGNFCAEFHGVKHKDEDFDHGPFATDHDAIADATRELSFIEYGFEWEE